MNTVANINREEFLRCLEAVEPGLSPKAIVEQSDAFVFEPRRVLTFNDEVACSGPSPLNGDVAGAVPSVKFLEILRKLTLETITVEVGEGELIVAGRKGGERFGVRLEKEVTLPVGAVEKPGEWLPLHTDFCEAVLLVGQCASTDQSRFEATCVHLHPKWVEAFDDMQMCRWKLPTGLTAPTLVRQSSIKHVASLGMTEFSETPSWLHFRNASGLIFSCRRYMEEFPSLSAILKQEGGEKVSLPKGLADATERAAVFSSENPDSNLVRVVLRPGKVRIRGEGVSGWYTKYLKCQYDGPTAEFLAPPQLLADIIKKHNDVLISKDKLKVVADRYTFLTCLVVPEETPDQS